MSDDLRTRIAAAIDRRYNDEAIGHTYEVCLHAADAVIRELNLTKVTRSQNPPIHRYVTEWETTK